MRTLIEFHSTAALQARTAAFAELSLWQQPEPNSTQQRFVPATVPQGFDGPESSCPKGFWDSHSNRFLLWFWVGPGSDGLFAKGWCGHNLLSSFTDLI